MEEMEIRKNVRKAYSGIAAKRDQIKEKVEELIAERSRGGNR